MVIKNEMRELAKRETLKSFLEYAKLNEICFYYHFAEFNANAWAECVCYAGPSSRHTCPAILHQDIGKCNVGLGNRVTRKNTPNKKYRRLEETAKNKKTEIYLNTELVENGYDQTKDEKKTEELVDLDQARRLVKKVIARNKK